MPLEKKPFKVKFEANDLDCLFEIQIGGGICGDFVGAIPTICHRGVMN